MQQNVMVRNAREDELEELAELAARSFVDTFASVNDPANIEHYLRNSLSVEKFTAEFAQDGSLFIVAQVDKHADIAGYAKLRRDSSAESVSFESTTEIERIYVDKPYLGQGVGAALIRACFAEARKAASDAIWLGVWEDNHAAIRFYERWGFAVVGSTSFTLGKERQTDLVMARAFAPGEEW